MKKMIFAIMMFFAVGAQAEPLAFDIGGTTLILPMQVVNATQMYSVDEQRGFTGAETTVAQRGQFDVTLGAATGYGNGISFPFVGIQGKLPAKYFQDVDSSGIKFGVWIGRDFDAKDTKWGLKASVSLW